MTEKETEACGRCSMTTVIDAAVDGEHDPFGDERIEVDSEDFGRISPAVWISKIGDRLNAAVRQITYGR